MPSTGSNRFAVFAERDEHARNAKHSSDSPSFALSPALLDDDDRPWEEVKGWRVGRNFKTVAIRTANKAPSIGLRSKPEREVSATNDKLAGFLPGNWCGICHHKFASKEALAQHVKNSPRHQHFCSLCKRVFKDRNGLQNHLDNASGHDIFCNICISAFKDHWGLKNHFENKMADGHQWVCMPCLKGFHNEADLEQHVRKSKKHVFCETCNLRFRNQDERDAHWATTLKHKHCLQPACKFDAPNMRALQLHLNQDHFQCQGCELIFPSATKLNTHVAMCKQEVQCPQCGEQRKGPIELATHQAECFFCRHCNIHLSKEAQHRFHMTKHGGIINCWGCDVPVHSTSRMLNHLESGHCLVFTDPELLTRCLGKFWYTSLYMDISVHKGLREGSYPAGEATTWMHERIIEPFICRDTAGGCGQTFSHFSALVRHVEGCECDWDIDRLRLDLVEEEFKRQCLEKDSSIKMDKQDLGGILN